MTFLIACELHQSRERYAELLARLEKWRATSVFEDAWIVSMPGASASLCNELSHYLGTDDGVVVVEFDGAGGLFAGILHRRGAPVRPKYQEAQANVAAVPCLATLANA